MIQKKASRITCVYLNKKPPKWYSRNSTGNETIDITTTSGSNYSGPSSDRRRLSNDTSPMHPRAYLVYGGTNKGWEGTDNHKSGTPGAWLNAT